MCLLQDNDSDLKLLLRASETTTSKGNPACPKRAHYQNLSLMHSGHDSRTAIKNKRMADDPCGRIGAKELGPICDFLGCHQAPCRGATDGLGDARFAIRHRFPGIGEHCPGG
jgi:hypothetical protein